MLLRQRVERFLKRARMSPSRFGREVLNDSHFVSKLREGRKVREKTSNKVRAWLDRYERRR